MPNKPQTLARRGSLRQLGIDVWKNRASYGLMAPYMILFITFTIIPVVAAICLSFTYFDMLQPPHWTGFLNYARIVLDDDIFMKVLQNTLVFAFLTGPLSYVIAFFLAWFINDFKPWLRTILTLVFYAPTLSGAVFFIWGYIFSTDSYGILNSYLVSLGIIREARDWLGNMSTIMPVLIIVQLWLSLGAGFLSFIAGFQTVDKSLYEAGVIDGVRNRWQELWYITLPSMGPQLLFGAVMQIGASFGVSQVIISLAGFPSKGYAADTIVTYIQDYGTVRYELGYASAIAVILFAAMILTNKIITNALRRFTAV